MAPRVVWSLQWNVVIHIESSSARNWCFSCKNVFFFPLGQTRSNLFLAVAISSDLANGVVRKIRTCRGNVNIMTVRFQSTQKGVQLLTQRLIKFAEKKQQVHQVHHSLQFFVVQPLLFCWTLEPRRISRCHRNGRENQQAASPFRYRYI